MNSSNPFAGTLENTGRAGAQTPRQRGRSPVVGTDRDGRPSQPPIEPVTQTWFAADTFSPGVSLPIESPATVKSSDVVYDVVV
ncbi:hypothetical protein BJP77_18340 [Mycobacterium avium subsp. hominissuis]|uniref:hypothetical protein n=1 Tax=Mycobacterium avium TaxID=1764 RepID=UPI001F173544|nr:hypothetical protein [Mycobacterium avium]